MEREAAHAVVKEINQQNADHWGLLFKLMGWEEAIPGYQRAQDKINEDLDRCDYFIGVMWDKWGSKPSNDPDGYTSGFEEEYHRSAQRIQNGLMKDMALFFKDIHVPPGMKPGPEIKKVLNFRKKCIDEKTIFFQDFGEIDTFKSAVRAKLMEIGWREFTDRVIAEEDSEEDDQPPMAQIEGERSSVNASGLLNEEAKYFLSGILDRSDEWDATAPSEVARLRLIAASISRSGNDETHLGTHDANLVFRHYRNADLSHQELNALLDCGVAGFEHQNTPLWRWLSKIDLGSDYLCRLRILATVGTVSEQVGAIRVLQLFGSPLPTHDGDYKKHGVLNDWLSENTETSVLDAVVSFLGTNGSEEDIVMVEAASANLPPYKKSKVDAAIVEIIARRSVEDAIRRICETQLSSIKSKLANRLLDNPQSLTTEVLELCLSAKSDEIRVGAANALFERGEIGEERANDLLTDDSVELRLIAAETLYRDGKELEDDVLEKVLKTQKPRTFGLFGMSGGTDAKHLESYRANRRAELSPSELVKRAENDALQYRCLDTLFQLYPSKAVSRMREGLQDMFAEYLDISTSGFREKFASEKKVLEILDDLTPSYQTALCNSAIKALCGLRKSEDLNLVRRCLDSMEIDADANIIKFFERFGEWQDIDRLLELGEKNASGFNALASPPLSFAEERAAALLSIGKNRVVDLLVLELDARVRAHLLKQVPNSTLASLSNEVVLRELAHSNAECRAIVALRCVQALPKSRVKDLLESYLDHTDYRYYNSIHWLDLGASLPKKLSKDLASRELANR
ncbi:MAG: hypothetical protein JJ894_03095 [Dinoroseobacter sp.]|nr:hypothetical protein [Dinoroseobacter sp.]